MSELSDTEWLRQVRAMSVAAGFVFVGSKRCTEIADRLDAESNALKQIEVALQKVRHSRRCIERVVLNCICGKTDALINVRAMMATRGIQDKRSAALAAEANKQ